LENLGVFVFINSEINYISLFQQWSFEEGQDLFSGYRYVHFWHNPVLNFKSNYFLSSPDGNFYYFRSGSRKFGMLLRWAGGFYPSQKVVGNVPQLPGS
jgi:hypothetical protein